MRRAVFVLDRVDILPLAADTEKFDRLDRAEFFMTMLQIWQLMTGRFGQGRAHLVIVGLAADETVNESVEGCLSSRTRNLALHLLCRLVCNLLRRCSINALHRVVAATLMQDK
jgi:hypothetical protein